jgi:hypothetical protein
MPAATKAMLSVGAIAAGAGIVAAYRRFLRDPLLTWGATAEEAGSRLPGDELLEDADVVSTRAITIEAAPGAVWPWLVQMGPHRGGAYTYDWIENLLGLDMHSADDIHPEWQDLDVGDVIPMRGEQLPGMRVEVMEAERAFVTRSEDGAWVWAFALSDEGGRTRLLSRNRIAMPSPSLVDRIGMAVMEPGSLIMERKMLHGIKARAERLAATVPAAGRSLA